MRRSNPYEQAFAAFLREREVPFLPVDELQRTPVAGSGTASEKRVDAGSLKSVDFVVTAGSRPPLLVDLKGRLFPSGKNRYWKNWVTKDDLDSLAAWEALWGGQAEGWFVFAYRLAGDRAPLPPELLFAYREQWYAFLAVRRSDYALHARPLSARWRTFSMAAAKFRETAVSIHEPLGILPSSPPPSVPCEAAEAVPTGRDARG